MRNLLIGLLAGLLVGGGGAIGYSHFLGEGADLVDTKTQLSATQENLTRVSTHDGEMKKETDALALQVHQLSSTNEELQRQVEQLKAAAVVAPPPAPPTTNLLSGMSGLIKAQSDQHKEQQLMMLKSRLHLTPDQEAKVQAALDAEATRTQAMTAQFLQGGKIDPTAMAKDPNQPKSLDQTLKDILTPDQKSAYQQMQTDQKNNTAETMAGFEMNQMTPLLQLTDDQKDKVYNALYQAQVSTTDPAWIQKNAPNLSKDPTSILDAQAKSKEDALAPILTPDQLATYHKQAQAQLDLQKAMMQKFMPAAAAKTP